MFQRMGIIINVTKLRRRPYKKKKKEHRKKIRYRIFYILFLFNE